MKKTKKTKERSESPRYQSELIGAEKEDFLRKRDEEEQQREQDIYLGKLEKVAFGKQGRTLSDLSVLSNLYASNVSDTEDSHPPKVEDINSSDVRAGMQGRTLSLASNLSNLSASYDSDTEDSDPPKVEDIYLPEDAPEHLSLDDPETQARDPETQSLSRYLLDEKRYNYKSKTRFVNRLGLQQQAVQDLTDSAPGPHVKIRENDLVFAKSKLKKVNKAFKPVKMNRDDILKETAIYDYLPLVDCAKAIRNTATSADLVSLNLSGIDQMTDVFFYYMHVTKMRLPALKTFIATGCNNLTDRGIRWLKVLLPNTLDTANLQCRNHANSRKFNPVELSQLRHESSFEADIDGQVNLNGCSKLTAESLYHLTKTESSQSGNIDHRTTVANINYMEISMMGTSVGVVPKNLLFNSNLSLKLNGCPLVSPPIERFKAHSFGTPPLKVCSLPVYKLLVLRHSALCSSSFTTTLGGSKSTTKPDGVTYLPNWTTDGLDVKLNIIEVNCDKVAPDVFLSKGSILMIPFDADTINQLGMKPFITLLVRNLYKVMYKTQQSMCLLVMLTEKFPSDPEMIETMETIQKEVNTYIRWLHSLVSDSIKNFMRQWKIEGLDFWGQEYLSSLVNIEHILKPNEQLDYLHIRVTSLPLTPQENNPAFPDTIKMAVHNIQMQYPWYEYLQAETLDAIKAVPSRLVANMDEVTKDVPEKVASALHPTNAIACMAEIVRIMSSKGMSVLLDTESKATSTDMTSFCDLISNLHCLPELRDPLTYIRSVTEPVVLWAEEELSQFMTSSGKLSKSETRRVIGVLQNNGFLLQLPCDALDAPAPYVYVLTQSLSPDVPSDLAHFWPESLPEGDVQVERFYQFAPEVPAFFIPLLLHHVSQMCELKRVWRNGAFICHAPVDLLIEYISPSSDVSFVYIGARIEESGNDDRTQKCLWSFFKLISNIMDYLLLKHDIFANITVPCKTCVADSSRYLMSDTSLCHHFTYHSLMCGYDRGPQCRVERDATPINKYAILRYIGPLGLTSVAPQHDLTYLYATKTPGLTPNRCFQCRRCAAEGIGCPQNNKPVHTLNHCACASDVALCPCCGICQRCVKIMSDIDAALCPSFSSRRRCFTSSDGEASSSTSENLVLFGSVVSGNTEGMSVQCLDWMSPEYFCRIDICLLRGVKLAIGLNLAKTKKQVTFELSSGVLTHGEETTKEDGWRVREGDRVSLVLEPHIDVKTVTLAVLWNDYRVTSLDLERQVIVPYVILVSPASFTLHTPGIKTQKQMDHSEIVPTYRLSEKMCLEYTTANGDVVTARITGYNNLQNMTIVTDHRAEATLSNAVTLDARRLTLHPPGYARHMGKTINGVPSDQFSWTDVIKDTAYILAPHWLFTEGQNAGSRPLPKKDGRYPMMTCTDLLSPAVLECRLAHLAEFIDRILYEKGGVNYSGTAIMTLPRDLPEASLMWPSRVMVAQTAPRQCLPLCYIRGDSADMLSLRPSKPQPRFTGSRYPFCYWQTHFLNTPGYPSPFHPMNPVTAMAYSTPKSATFTPLLKGDSADMLSLRPSQPQPRFTGSRYPFCYWQAHFLNAPGFTCPGGGMEDGRLLQCLWNISLKFQSSICLPNVDKLSPDVSKIPHKQLERSVHEYAHIQAMASYLRHDITRDTFNDLASLTTLESAAEYLQDLVLSNLPTSGLTEHTTTLTNDRILICNEHIASLQTERDLNYFPMDKFGQYAKFISSLIADGNKIHTLPEDFFKHFPLLLDFQFGMNGLQSLPKSISHCEDLYSLRLGANHLVTLPDELAQCQKLSRLEISANLMDEVPPVVMKLASLERLYIQQMQLSHLPDNIGDLTNLVMLYASGNCFSSLPPSFTKLQRLNDLALNGVLWFDVKKNRVLSREQFERFLTRNGIADWMDDHDVDKTAMYQYFDENKNGTLEALELSKLDATMFLMFPRFGHQDTQPPEDPDNVAVCGVPDEILALENLEYLSLQYQGIVAIPDSIEKLARLSVLNLAHNPFLTSISASAAKLPLKRLELDGCPSLRTPPKEIRVRGFTSTLAYLKRLLSGSCECHRTKLMLVGLGGAGKTSLVRALLSDDSKAETLTSEDITDGIDITDWTIQAEGDPITYSVWDFAGQTVYYNTHQFFLTERSVYLLLWNIRLGHEHAGLDFWLSSITVHAPNAPIFVIGTHLDQVAKTELPIAEMSAKYPQIVGFHFISSLTGKGVRELQTQLVDVTLQQPYMGEKIPGVWLNFEQAIITERAKESVVKYKQIEDIAAKSGIFEQTEVVQAVQFLHDLGSLQHINNQFLKDYVVINPQWIVDVMACVVSVKDSPIKEGKFHHRDIGVVWKDYPPSLHEWLLRLTEEFDLTFPLKDQDVSLVPCLLPETQPQFDWPELGTKSLEKRSKMVYKFSYLPAGLFNRAQVRLYQISDSSLIWKKGSLLRKSEHIALLMQNKDNEMWVNAQGVRPGNILLMVHEVFEGLIAESFTGVTYDYLIPCPDCIKFNCRDPHMFAASTIRRASELTAPFLQCLKYFHNISLIHLLATMPPDTNADYDIHIVSAVRGLKDLKKDISADVFVSYCQANLPKPKDKVIHPQNVCKDLEKTGYKCWYQSSDKEPTGPTDEMLNALTDCKIFVAFISNEYCDDKNCADIFKYARLRLGKPIVLVVLKSEMEWKRSNLGILVVDEVYIDMQKADMYSKSFEFLLKSMRDRITGPCEEVDHPPVFISYAWQNSAEAVAAGIRSVPGAVGPGDPRLIQQYMEKNGIKCWIDQERVGANALIDDIDAGLRHSKLMVACVSDAYSLSTNCQMEFRYAANELKLPIVLAVVGTTNAWRASEIGILSVDYPLVSFQEKSQTAPQKLLEIVNSKLGETADDSTEESECERKMKADKSIKSQKDLSFQELYELAQRKFMRQISMIAEGQDLIYPRLIVADFKKDMNQDAEPLSSVPEDKVTNQRPGSANSGNTSSFKSVFKISLKSRESNLSSQSGVDFHQEKYCFHILCEHEEGWHSVGEPVDAPENFGQGRLDSCVPYLSRITAIVKYNRQLMLKCMLGQEGDHYIKWLEKSPQSSISDFDMVYKDLRSEVSGLDHVTLHSRLARCHLPNGKTIWLCDKHQRQSRVTILSDDAVAGVNPVGESALEGHILDSLNTLDITALNLKLQPTEKRIRKLVANQKVTPLIKTKSQLSLLANKSVQSEITIHTSEHNNGDTDVKDASGIMPKHGKNKKGKDKQSSQVDEPRASMNDDEVIQREISARIIASQNKDFLGDDAQIQSMVAKSKHAHMEDSETAQNLLQSPVTDKGHGKVVPDKIKSSDTDVHNEDVIARGNIVPRMGQKSMSTTQTNSKTCVII